MITIHESARPGKVVRNGTSLSAPAWTNDSTVVQLVGCLKG